MPPKWSLSPPRWHRSADQVSDLKAGIDLGHGPRRTLSELGVGFSMAGDQTAGLSHIASVVGEVGLIGMGETTTGRQQNRLPVSYTHLTLPTIE